MSFRLATLLCLSGLAACNNENTRDAQYAPDNQPQASNAEPAMTPASFEEPGRQQPNQADRKTTPSGTGSVNDPAPAPLAPATGPEPAAADSSKRATSEPAKTAPDNTKVNERDRNTAAPTPLDQGQNETDLKITQQIRQAVMADGTLSFTAKNVKIITQNGKVTLRGPVNTAQERGAIEAAARKIAGAAQVDNQIEVKK
jgi:hyperosmotically inducible periplasmic protein